MSINPTPESIATAAAIEAVKAGLSPEQTEAVVAATLAQFGFDSPAKVTSTKVDGRNHAARKHNYERRMHRRETTAMGGLTKAERSALYAKHPELSAMSATARAKAWKKIVAEYKAA